MASAGSIQDDLVPEGSPRISSEGIDPELLDLPAPAKGRRLATMALMALSVVVALGLLASIRRDVSYFFHPGTPVALGEAVALEPAELEPNSYVTVEGTPMASGTVGYGRILGTGRYRAFPLAGQRNLYVQLPVESDDAARTSARRAPEPLECRPRQAVLRARRGRPDRASTPRAPAGGPPASGASQRSG